VAAPTKKSRERLREVVFVLDDESRNAAGAARLLHAAAARGARVLDNGVDRGEELRVIASVTRRLLDMLPPDDAIAVDEEIRAVRVEAIFEEHIVAPRDVASEIAEEVHREVVLRLVLLQRVRGIDADRQDDDTARQKLIVIVPHLAQLGRTGAREGEGEKGEQNRFAPQRRKRQLFTRGGSECEVRRAFADRWTGRGTNDCHSGMSRRQ